MAPTDVKYSSLQSWADNPLTGLSLDAAGLVALADIETIEERTALTGTATYLDIFVLCPGIHRQQHATGLNRSELPPCAALTTGYVFRVENPATVFYLQKVGKTGRLVRVEVSQRSERHLEWARIRTAGWTSNSSVVSSFCYLATVLFTLVALVFVIFTGDWWALVILLNLMLARLCNTMVVRRRSNEGWKGVKEPGVKGELLILLSQDRWIRMKGDVDDLKAVTSGQWMRDMSFAENSLVAAATVLVYLDAALASNAKQSGKIALVVLLLVSAGSLGLSNDRIQSFQMFGRCINVIGKPKPYKRRLDLAQELIQEFGTDDWAVGLGMIKPSAGSRQDKAVEIVL